jgi:hypothetical protein
LNYAKPRLDFIEQPTQENRYSNRHAERSCGDKDTFQNGPKALADASKGFSPI